MAKNLYNKYRPTNFSDFIGQKHIFKLVKFYLKSSNMPFYYVINGKKGTGKTSFCRIFYFLVNCIKPVGLIPCGSCTFCLSHSLADYFEFDAAFGRKLSDVSKLYKIASFYPLFGKYKVIVVDESHMLTKYAFDFFLKFIEEDHGSVFIFFVSTIINRIPTSIISRCILLNFFKISYYNTYKCIKKVSYSENFNVTCNSLRLISVLSDGSLRDALVILEQSVAYSNNNLNSSIVYKTLNYVDIRYVLLIIRYILLRDKLNLSILIIYLINLSADHSNIISEVLKFINIILYSDLFLIVSNFYLVTFRNYILYFKQFKFKKKLIKLKFKIIKKAYFFRYFYENKDLNFYYLFLSLV